jgi:L-iditol 2-dehydrogenase
VAAGHRHYGFTVNGGYAQYAVNHLTTLHRIPDALNFEEATLITTAGTGMYGITRVGGIDAGETVVVAGPGPIGLMAVQLAKAVGAGRVIITGTRDERLSLARELGADLAVNTTKENVIKRVLELTGGLGADVVLECAGSSGSLSDAVEFTRRNGRIGLVGIYSEPVASTPQILMEHHPGGKPGGGKSGPQQSGPAHGGWKDQSETPHYSHLPSGAGQGGF